MKGYCEWTSRSHLIAELRWRQHKRPPEKRWSNREETSKKNKTTNILRWSKDRDAHTPPDTHNNDKHIYKASLLAARPSPPSHTIAPSPPCLSLSSPHFYVCIILIIQSNQSILLSLWLAVGAAILLSLCSVIALWQGMMASAEPFHLTLGVYRAEPSLRSPLSLCTQLAGPAWCPSYNFADCERWREREGRMDRQLCAVLCEEDIDREVCALL